MGVIHHNAVVATTWSDESFDAMREWVRGLDLGQFGCGPDDQERVRGLFVFGEGVSNNYHTVVMVPDGSKEGWGTSDLCDKLRAAFVARLCHDEHWQWVEVGFGERGQQISGNNRNCY